MKQILFWLLPLGLLGCLGGDPADPGDKAGSIGAVTAPAAGQVFFMGDTITVGWSGEASSVEVFFRARPTAPWSKAIPVSSGAGAARIVAPAFDHSPEARIRVVNAADPADAAESPDFFVKALMLTHPLGGESFQRGDTVLVTWKANRDLVTGVQVFLSMDNGKTYDQLTLSGQADPSGHFVWIPGSEGIAPPAGYPCTECRIKIEDYQVDEIDDKSGPLTVD